MRRAENNKNTCRGPTHAAQRKCLCVRAREVPVRMHGVQHKKLIPPRIPSRNADTSWSMSVQGCRKEPCTKAASKVFEIAAPIAPRSIQDKPWRLLRMATSAPTTLPLGRTSNVIFAVSPSTPFPLQINKWCPSCAALTPKSLEA